MSCAGSEEDAEPIKVSGPDDPQIAEISDPADAEIAAEEIALAREAQKPFDVAAFLEGHLTPVFFGSALKKFGVQRSDRRLGRIRAAAPAGRGLDAHGRCRARPKMTGFVFKIQANMDPNHRDRIAFLRVTLGTAACAA